MKLGYKAAARRKSNKGFANMSPERRKEIAAKGGKASRGGGIRYPKFFCEDKL